jgi:ABC-2 type transport system permease protein
MTEKSEPLSTAEYVAVNLEPALLVPPGVIFLQTLRDNLPGILAWGVGYSVLIGLVTLLYPILEENNTLLGVVRGLGLMGVGGNSNINIQTMTSFAGYIAFEALSWAPLVLSIYLIPQALNAVSREEERGTLDILLSTPLPRWRLLLEKTAAIVASLVGILAIMWVALVVSSEVVQAENFTVYHATAGIWHILPISLTITALTLLFSVTVRSSRSAGGLAALFILASYFLRAITDMVTGVPILQELAQLSLFAYYRSLTTLANGFQWGYDSVLLSAAFILFAVALWQFQKRDIGV